MGSLVHHVEIDGWALKNINPTYMDLVRAQDEMITVLREAGGDSSSMDLPNKEGKTPRQLQEETRVEWRRREEWKRHSIRGRGQHVVVSDMLERTEDINVL